MHCTASVCRPASKEGRKRSDQKRRRRRLTDGLGRIHAGVPAAAGGAARLGHAAAAGLGAVAAAAGAGGRRDALAALSLPVQLLPFGPVGLDHVKHGLEFGIQLDQRLEERKREREREKM